MTEIVTSNFSFSPDVMQTIPYQVSRANTLVQPCLFSTPPKQRCYTKEQSLSHDTLTWFLRRYKPHTHIRRPIHGAQVGVASHQPSYPPFAVEMQREWRSLPTL